MDEGRKRLFDLCETMSLGECIDLWLGKKCPYPKNDDHCTQCLMDAILGIDFNGYTIRQLIDMAEESPS